MLMSCIPNSALRTPLGLFIHTPSVNKNANLLWHRQLDRSEGTAPPATGTGRIQIVKPLEVRLHIVLSHTHMYILDSSIFKYLWSCWFFSHPRCSMCGILTYITGPLLGVNVGVHIPAWVASGHTFHQLQDPNSGGDTGPQAFTALQCAAECGHLEVRGKNGELLSLDGRNPASPWMVETL